MKRILVGLAALAVVLVVPMSAGATRPVPITLTFSLNVTGNGTAAGDWTGTTTTLAVLEDKTGTATETFKLTGKGRVVHGKKVVQSGSGDSFVIQFNGKTSPGDNGTTNVKGHFVIKNGKGIYKGLHGTGKVSSTLSADGKTIAATYTGKAHLEPKKAQNQSTTQDTKTNNGKAKGKSK